jgi:hypothetical protein
MHATDQDAGMKHLLRDIAADALFSCEGLPVRERILDRLSDLMFCADEVLQMISADGSLAQCEKPVRRAYDEINGLMKTLCD